MATKSTGWSCTHAVSVDNSDVATTKVTVTCYWQNNGWKYDITYVSAWVYCGDKSYQVKNSGSIDANSSTSQKVSCGSHTFTINKTTAAQSLSCYAKITSKSSYVSGTKTSTATKASISAKATYEVTYNANGGTNAPSTQTKTHGVALKLSNNKPTRSGYTFAGWGTTATDTSVNYNPGDSYTGNADLLLYAIWTAKTYTVTYNANGGTSAPSAQTKTHGVDLTLTSSKPTRTNYTFKGWGTSVSSTTVSYASGAKYTANSNATLYAIWTLAYTKPRISNVRVERCDIDSNNKITLNDEGACFALYFDWATDKSDPTYKVEWKQDGTSWNKATSSESESLSGTSGKSVCFTAEGISVEKTFNVRLTVTDSDSSEVYIDVPSLMMALDVYPAVSSYLHLESITKGSANECISYRTSGDQYFSHEANNTYRLTFFAKSNVDGTVLVSNVGRSASNLRNHPLTTEWSQYGMTYVAEKSGSFTFWLKDAGTECDIRDINLAHLTTVNGEAQLVSKLPLEASYDTSYWIHNGEGAFEAVTINNGLGVAIGKTAETANLFDVAMQSRLRKTVCIGDKTGYLDGNSGVYLHSAGYMHLQRDPANGHPYIGFLTDQGEGEAMSAFIRFNKSRNQMEYLNAPSHRFSQEIYVSGDKLTHNDGKAGWYFGTDGTAHSTNASAGGGLYFHYGSSTDITSQIRETSSGVLTIGKKLIVAESQNVLWSGSYYMSAGQTAPLSEAISSQLNGIVLVFCRYTSSAAQNYHFNSFFISKQQISKHGGCGHTFLITGDGSFSTMAAKYLYIHDTQIAGNDINKSTGTASGITYGNNGYVLRYVYGV